MNPYREVVDKLKLKSERFASYVTMSGGRVGARANRGVVLCAERREALIWGLRHDSPVVRRCVLELLDQHPDPASIPHIVACLEDSVPRVRWHAVHTLICDVCKQGTSHLSADVEDRIRTIANTDPSAKVRRQAELGLQKAAALRD